jgi:hypothetical protein
MVEDLLVAFAPPVLRCSSRVGVAAWSRFQSVPGLLLADHNGVTTGGTHHSLAGQLSVAMDPLPTIHARELDYMVCHTHTQCTPDALVKMQSNHGTAK